MSYSYEPEAVSPPLPRPTYRAPIGLPVRDEGRVGVVASVTIHLLIVFLLIVPLYYKVTTIVPIEQGAGGAGPAGGGGGGRGGESGYRETLRFVKVARDPVPTPTSIPPVPKPEIPKVQPPVLPPTPPVQQIKPQDDAAVPAPQQVASTVGAGPGSGNDGTTGNGPGTGGGIGSGVGTGRGSGVGPGTGGGNQANYPPQPIEFFLPPMPPPSSVKGTHFIAEFDVDSTGRVLDFKFSETRDGDYNRRIAGILRSMRFRPGTRADGTPLRMKAQVGYEF